MWRESGLLGNPRGCSHKFFEIPCGGVSILHGLVIYRQAAEIPDVRLHPREKDFLTRLPTQQPYSRINELLPCCWLSGTTTV